MTIDTDEYCMSWIKYSKAKGPLRQFLTKLVPYHLTAQVRFEFHMLMVRL
jgi:hypothetical protein